MKNSLLLTILSLSLLSCSADQQDKQPEADSFMVAAWTGGGIAETEAEWREELASFSEHGLSDLFLSAGIEETAQVVTWAQD